MQEEPIRKWLLVDELGQPVMIDHSPWLVFNEIHSLLGVVHQCVEKAQQEFNVGLDNCLGRREVGQRVTNSL